MMIFVRGLVIPVISGFRTIPESIKNDQMYVQEATYEETHWKTYMIFVTMKVKGRSKYVRVDLLKCEEFESGDRIIILQKRGRKWAFKERIIASELPVDNLYIEGLWNIKDTAPKDNLCTGCQVIDDETFAFTTFGGGRFVMRIKDGVIELVSKMLVK